MSSESLCLPKVSLIHRGFDMQADSSSYPFEHYEDITEVLLSLLIGLVLASGRSPSWSQLALAPPDRESFWQPLIEGSPVTSPLPKSNHRNPLEEEKAIMKPHSNYIMDYQWVREELAKSQRKIVVGSPWLDTTHLLCHSSMQPDREESRAFGGTSELVNFGPGPETICDLVVLEL
ncbi:hypothetical protein BTVI_43459 [Pitangus sulphuratus]|nr:hypothetical protein BTVI_43459 [Pitangus sulphuratus]